MPSTASADPGRGGVLKPAKIRLERWNDWSLQTVGARRAELVRAAAAGVEAGFQSPVAGPQLEFRVAVTRTGEAGLVVHGRTDDVYY